MNPSSLSYCLKVLTHFLAPEIQTSAKVRKRLPMIPMCHLFLLGALVGVEHTNGPNPQRLLDVLKLDTNQNQKSKTTLKHNFHRALAVGLCLHPHHLAEELAIRLF